MATLEQQILQIIEDYRSSGEPWPATSPQMAEWAVRRKRYQLTEGMAVAQCAERLSRTMQRQHVRDHRGRSVRRYYSARVRRNDQLVMAWDDWNADRPFMEMSAANRRNQILGECHQLKKDIDSYNERRTPERPIQVEFNFTIDLEELDQLDEIA
jgi:hypothetical protein